MVKIEIRIQGAVRDNIVCKWVTEEEFKEKYLDGFTKKKSNDYDRR